MPIWMWIFLVACIAYGGLVLWRAWAKEFVKFGPIHMTRNEYPFSFWFFVVLFFIGEVWFIGMFFVIIISLMWGPIAPQ